MRSIPKEAYKSAPFLACTAGKALILYLGDRWLGLPWPMQSGCLQERAAAKEASMIFIAA